MIHIDLERRSWYLQLVLNQEIDATAHNGFQFTFYSYAEQRGRRETKKKKEEEEEGEEREEST